MRMCLVFSLSVIIRFFLRKLTFFKYVSFQEKTCKISDFSTKIFLKTATKI